MVFGLEKVPMICIFCSLGVVTRDFFGIVSHFQQGVWTHFCKKKNGCIIYLKSDTKNLPCMTGCSKSGLEISSYIEFSSRF